VAVANKGALDLRANGECEKNKKAAEVKRVRQK